MKQILFILFLLISSFVYSQSSLHTSLVGYWNFDESTGDLVDQVNSNDGVTSGVAYDSTGKINTSYYFSSGDYITMPDNSYIQFYNTNLSFSAWVYVTAYPSTNNEYAIIGSEDYGAGLAINALGHIIYTEAAYDSATVASTGKVTLSAWTHVGVTFNFTTNAVAYYLNGVASGTATMAGDVVLNASSNKFGDNWWSNDYFVGKLDEVGFWKKVLTAAEMDTLYNGPDGSGADGYTYPFGGSCPAFVGGTIGSNQSISSGADVAAFTSSVSASGGTGAITYQWKYSTTSSDPLTGSWTNTGTSSTTYDHGTLTATTYFVRYASAATCGSGYSNVLTITVTTGADSPVFRLRFEGNGVDASGNGFAGKHTGTDSTYSTGVEGTYSYNPGVSGGSFNDNWESKGVYTFADRTFTASFNFRAIARYMDSHIIFTNKQNSGSAGFSLRFDEATSVINGRTTTAGLVHNEFSTELDAIDFGTQYHIIAVFRSGSVTLYFNGIKQTLADSVIATDWGGLTDTLAIGSYTDLVSGGWYESGYLDNFHFYDYEVSSLQADSLFTYRNSSTYQLSGAAPAVGYFPPTGYKNYYVAAIRKKPYVSGVLKYGDYGLNPAVTTTDTITYVLYDRFETWTNASVQSYDSLIKRIPMSGYFMPAQQAIVYFDGEHGYTWQSTMLNLGATSMEYYMPLGDTFSDVYFDYDLFAESNFNNIGVGGIASHKFPGGFEGGDDLDLYGDDSISRYGGRGGWSGLVSGNANYELMIYPYGQPAIGSTYWQGVALGTDGTFPIPRGYWIHITYRHHMNTPGQYDGFSEVYINGVLTIRRYGLKWRSVQQGEDYGKVEQLRMEFFFGGGLDDSRNSVGENTIWMDNWVVYKYNSGANNYNRSYGNWGDVTSQVRPPGERLMPPDIQLDETYTNATDTIYDNGKDKGYLMWPAFKNEEITKVVTRPSGTINYSFVSAQFGYNWPNDCAYVEVYSGTGTGKIFIRSFGASSCGYTQPSGNYSIPDNEATFIIYPGSTYGYTKGIAIRYWQP